MYENEENMREIIKKGHDYRIIPQNFESATIFEVISINDNDFEIELTKATQDELKDYQKDTKVEIFGSGTDGLIFFESQITEQNGTHLKVKIPEKYNNIQRREYSRVKFMGELDIEGENDNLISVEDISAGGLKLITKKPLEAAKDYKITIKLINNMTIRCLLHPIRIEENENNQETSYIISGCYKDIASIDRIALVQYSFKTLMETENRENGR